MSYQTTITRKGQITIPKKIRETLKLKEGEKLEIEFNKKEGLIKLKLLPDILEIAGTFKRPGKRINVLKAREKMEKQYERA